MSLQWPTPLFTSDGGGSNSFAKPVACGLPEFFDPIPATTKPYIFTEKWMQFQANWNRIPLNSVHPSTGLTPDYSSYFLVSEEKRRDMQHGVVEWERRYAIKPDSHDEYETYSYEFIGYLGAQFSVTAGNPTWNGALIDPSSGTLIPIASPFTTTTSWNAGRPRFSPPGGVTTRVRHDYFIIGPTEPAWSASGVYLVNDYVSDGGNTYICIANVGPSATHPGSDPSHWLGVVCVTPDYATPGDIPTIRGLLYFNTNYSVFANGLYADYLMNALGSLTASVPSQSQYSAWIAKAQSLGWASDIALNGGSPWTANTGQFPAEDSRISRWQGNIWVRQTRYILAQ